MTDDEKAKAELAIFAEAAARHGGKHWTDALSDLDGDDEDYLKDHYEQCLACAEIYTSPTHHECTRPWFMRLDDPYRRPALWATYSMDEPWTVH